MTAITENTDYFVKQDLPNPGFKTLVVSTVTTADSSDTIAIDIAKYGGGAVMGVIGFTHTTANSVVIQEQPTTTMSGSTLTITIGGAANDQARHYLVFLATTKNP
jgi:predicted transporter